MLCYVADVGLGLGLGVGVIVVLCCIVILLCCVMLCCVVSCQVGLGRVCAVLALVVKHCATAAAVIMSTLMI